MDVLSATVADEVRRTVSAVMAAEIPNGSRSWWRSIPHCQPMRVRQHQPPAIGTKSVMRAKLPPPKKLAKS